MSLSHGRAVVWCSIGQRGLGVGRGDGEDQRGGAYCHEATDKSTSEAHAQGVYLSLHRAGFIVTHITRDCGAVVKYWPAGRGETEEEGETYFGFSAVEPSGTTSGTTSGTNHVQGTRDCGVIM